MKCKDCALDSTLVKQVFEETLDILGERTNHGVIFDLKCAGEYDAQNDNISLEKITIGLQCLFGAEAVELIIAKIFLALDELTIIAKK